MANDDLEMTGQQEEAEGSEQNPYLNVELISKRINKARDVDKFHRPMFEREWFRNILFMIGQHWIIYDGSKWRKKNLPGWYPRAQTNKFSEKANDLVATLIQSGRVPIRYTPANQDPENIATAEIGERVRAVMYEEANIDDKMAELAMWLVLTGNVFLIPYYDTDDKHGSVQEQAQRCVACQTISPAQEIASNGGMCPVCTEQGNPASSEFIPAVDPEGNDVVDEVPRGALQTDICSPFEIRIDHRVTRDEDQMRFVRVRRYDVEFAKEHWKDAQTPDGKPVNIQPDGNADLSQFYLDILSHATANFSGSGGTIGADNGSGKHERVTVYELFEMPTKDFPEGLHAVRVGSELAGLVEAGPLTTEYGAGAMKGKKFLPLIHFGFDTVPGRYWHKTRLDDVIPLQIFRNTVEANLRLTAQRMGNAIWLNPKGSGVDVLTGEPGQRVDYNPVSLGGTSFAKPERVEAALGNIQPLILLINKIDDAIERVSGTFFLQGGDTPPGVTAASALAYLGERAQRSMSPLMREWAKGWKRWEEQALEIARASWVDDRIRMVAGHNKIWEAQVFKQSDLSGSVVMDIDYNGLMPKSNATDRAEVGQLIQLQVVNPQDPQQNYAILKLFGKTSLLGAVDLDTKEATKENEKFMAGDDQAFQLLPMIQNDQLHIAIHSDLCKTDEFKVLPPERQQIVIQHVQMHVQSAIAYQQMLGQAQMAAQTPPGGMGSDAAAQNGGVPSGATSPDGRLNADGTPKNPDIAQVPEINDATPPGENGGQQQAA